MQSAALIHGGDQAAVEEVRKSLLATAVPCLDGERQQHRQRVMVTGRWFYISGAIRQTSARIAT